MSEFVSELAKNRIVPKCPVCGLSGLRRKCDAALTASRDYVIVQVLKELKCAVVCYFKGRIFNPTTLLNNVAPSIELLNADANLSNLILIITALCNNLEHLRLTR